MRISAAQKKYLDDCAHNFAEAQIDLDAKQSIFDLSRIDIHASEAQRREDEYKLFWARISRNNARARYLEAKEAVWKDTHK